MKTALRGASALALPAALVLALATATPAQAATSSATRIAGADRYETSVKVSQSTFNAADVVFIASGENFPDALAAGPAAAHAGAPVLLTPKDRLDPRVRAEVERLDPSVVVIVGGESSVSRAVADELSSVVEGSEYANLVDLDLDALVDLGGVGLLSTPSPQAAQPAGLIGDGGLIGNGGLIDTGGLIGGGGSGGSGSGGLIGDGGLVDVDLDLGVGDLIDLDLDAGVDLGDLDLGNLADVDLGVGLGDLDLGLDVGLGVTDGIGVNVGLDLGLGDLGIDSERAVLRAGGEDRYETAELVALLAWGDYSGPVYVARGDIFPDALSGGAAAASLGAPLVLSPTDSLSGHTRDYLSGVNTTSAVIFGSSAALSERVEADVKGIATTTRIGGADRYETAALAAARHHRTPATAFLATGENYPDALSGIPAAALRGAPVVLTRPSCTPTSTSAYVRSAGPSSLVVLGGEASVSTDGLRRAC